MKNKKEIKKIYHKGRIYLRQTDVLKLIKDISDWKDPKKTWEGEKNLRQFREELKQELTLINEVKER